MLATGPADTVLKGAANARCKGGRVPHVAKIRLRACLHPTDWLCGDRACD